MRFAGSSAPGIGVGPAGQLAIALRPARIAERYDTLSCALRPGFRRIGVESLSAAGLTGVSVGRTAGGWTSPGATRAGAALDPRVALVSVPHPMSTAAAITRQTGVSFIGVISWNSN